MRWRCARGPEGRQWMQRRPAEILQRYLQMLPDVACAPSPFLMRHLPLLDGFETPASLRRLDFPQKRRKVSGEADTGPVNADPVVQQNTSLHTPRRLSACHGHGVECRGCHVSTAWPVRDKGGCEAIIRERYGCAAADRVR